MNRGIRNQSQFTEACAEGEVRASRRLWASVVRAAADDLHSKFRDLNCKARAWFASEDEGLGTFMWCCDVLDLNAQAVRRAIADGRAKSSHGGYANLLKVFNETRDHDETSDQEV